MPNWTSNTIKFSSAQDLQKVLSYVKSGENVFDFDRLIPEPRKIEDCPQDFILTEKERATIQPEKSRPWYNWFEWRWHFWGTKFNSSDSYIASDGLSVSFETAWDSPTPIFLKLAEIFKEIPFSVESYFEEGGSILYHYAGDGSGFVEIIEKNEDFAESDF